MNNFFINFRNEHIHLIHLLVVLLQVLDVPPAREPLSVHGFQVITALLGVVDYSVKSFPCGAKLSLGRIFSRCGNIAQNEVSYVKSSEFYSLIVVFDHFLLEALSLTSSRQSRLNHSLSLPSLLNASRLMLVIPTSIGITASVP